MYATWKLKGVSDVRSDLCEVDRKDLDFAADVLYSLFASSFINVVGKVML